MSDTPTPPSSPDASFCGECGAAMPADARFCGSCGAAPPGAAGAGAMPGAGDEPTQVGGASAWQGVAPVVERDPTAAIPTTAVPPVPPGAAAPPPGPPPIATGPAGGPPPPGTGKSKGPLIAAIVVVLALLAGGAFFLLGGDDDEEDDVAIEREDRDDEEDEETTTTEAPEEETTTTEAPEDETTTTEAPDAPAITFVDRLDDSSALVVSVPDFWQVNGAPLGDGSPNIIASEDLTAFTSGFQASGVSFTRLPGANADPDATIDFLATTNNLFEACTPDERVDYTDGVFTGRRQDFNDCEGSGITLVEIVGTRSDGVSVEVTIALAPDDPFEIVTEIENSFNLTA